MTRGIEAAFWGTLGRDPELKTSRAGKPYATIGVAVTVGQDDAGRDVTQWVRVACFGENAERIAAGAKKGDRVYCEGTLTQSHWTTQEGQARVDLQLAAWKVEKVSQIGKARAKREPEASAQKPAERVPGAASTPIDLNEAIPF